MIDVKILKKAKESAKSGESGIVANRGGGLAGDVVREAAHAARADKADYAEEAGNAKEAEHALAADNAATADEAAHAQTADNATEAEHAQKAYDLDEDSPVRDQFLSRLADDVAKGKITFEKGLEIGEYSPGASGGMFGMDADGGSFAEVARLYVRVKAFFEELTIVKSNVLAGKQYITPGGGIKCVRVVETSDAYRCYFLTEQDGEKTKCMFIVGDQAICESFDIEEGTHQKVMNQYYWRAVTAVSNDALTDENTGNKYGYIELSKTNCAANSGIPQEGDEICQLGYQGSDANKERRSAMVFSTVDADSPSIKLYSGINSFSLEDRAGVSFGYDPKTGQIYFRLGTSSAKHYLDYRQGKGLVVAGSISSLSTYDDGSGDDRTLGDVLSNNIDNTDVLYILHTSGTEAPALPSLDSSGNISNYNDWSTEPPQWEEGKYIWQTTYVHSTGNGALFKGTVCIPIRQGQPGQSSTITSQSVTYSTDHGASQPNDSTFTETTIPTLSQGQYLWSRTMVTYSGNPPTTTKSYAVSRVGTDGTSDSLNLLLGSKKGIVFDSTDYSSALNFASAVNSDGFLESTITAKVVPTGTVGAGNNNMYLFAQKHLTEYFKTGETYTFSADIKSNAPVILYIDSRGGSGGTLRNLAIEAPSTGNVWKRVSVTAVMPSVGTNTQSVITFKFSSGVVGSTASVRKMCLRKGTSAEYSSAASEMLALTITERSVTYAKTTDATQPDDSEFKSDTIAALNLSEGDYMWSKTEVKYSDGTSTKSYAVSRIGADGDTQVAGLHIAYATDITGSLPHPTAVTGFATSMQAGNTYRYMGIYTDDKEEDSLDHNKYEWAEFRGTDAKSVIVNASEQAFMYKDNFASLVNPQQTIKITAALQNTTECEWTYKQAGATGWSSIPPTDLTADGGISMSPTGYIIGSAKSVTVRCTSGDVFDEVTIYKVSSGTNGINGNDGYTVFLTNESHIFEGDTTKAIAGSTECGIVAYKGATRVAATISTITGAPSGMTAAVANNGTTSAKFTVTVNSNLTEKQGTLNVPITVDGKSFTRVFSWSLSLEGNGIDRIEEEYFLSTSQTQLLGDTWHTKDDKPTWVAGKYMWTRSHVYYTDGTDETYGEVCSTGATGAAAPNLVIKYSAVGDSNENNWHPTYLAGDLWMKTSNDGGNTWSTPVRIQGANYSNNLLTGTQDWSGARPKGDPGTLTTETYNGNTVLQTAAEWAARLWTANIENGKTYTFSADVLATAQNLVLYTNVNTGWGVTATSKLSTVKALTALVLNQWTRVYYVFKCTQSGSLWIDIEPKTAATLKIAGCKLEEGDNRNPEWSPAASEMVGQEGQYRKFQWAKNNSTTTAPTTGWQDEPLTASPGEYVWMCSGIVVPPATEPAAGYETAIRLTGDKGPSGDSVYQLDLSDEMMPVACNSSGTVTGTYKTSQATVYKGGTKVTTGITYSIAQQTGVSATVTSAGVVTPSNLTADRGTIVVQAVVAGVTLQTTLNLYKVKPGTPGAAAEIYSLEVSDNTISRNALGVLSASSLTVKKYKTTGASMALTTEKYIYYQRLGVDASAVLLGSASSGTVPLSTDEAMTAVVIELRSSTATSYTLLDRERIPVVSDGEGLTKNLVYNSESYITTSDYMMAKFTTIENLVMDETYTFTIWGEPGEGKTFAIWDSKNSLTPKPHGRTTKIADGVYSVVATWYRNSAAVDNEIITAESTIKRIKIEKGANPNPIWTASPRDVDYVKMALREGNTVEAGLVLASLIKCGYTLNGSKAIRAGMSGFSIPESALAFWSGGDMLDATDPVNSNYPENDDDAITRLARFGMRHDGNGYLCKGVVRILDGAILIGQNRDSAGKIKSDAEFKKDCISLDEHGLTFYQNGNPRLRVSNESVGDDVTPKISSKTLNIASTSLGTITFKHYKETSQLLLPGQTSGSGTPIISTNSYYWIPTSGAVLTKDLPIKTTSASEAETLTVGQTIKINNILTSNPGFTLDVSNKDNIQLSAKAYLFYADSSGSAKIVKTVTLQRISNGNVHNFQGSLTHTVTVSAKYYLRVSLIPNTDTKGELVTTTTSSTSHTAAASGTLETSNSDFTLIGIDGIKSLWSSGSKSGGLLANANGVKISGSLIVNGKTIG